MRVPAIRIGSRYLTAPDSRLLITLDLPGGTIGFEGLTQRYDQLELDGNEKSYFLAVKIRQISESDRARYLDYLRTLK
jgi:hypothetical protein